MPRAGDYLCARKLEHDKDWGLKSKKEGAHYRLRALLLTKKEGAMGTIESGGNKARPLAVPAPSRLWGRGDGKQLSS
jgi:hypothetical protein